MDLMSKGMQFLTDATGGDVTDVVEETKTVIEKTAEWVKTPEGIFTLVVVGFAVAAIVTYALLIKPIRRKANRKAKK